MAVRYCMSVGQPPSTAWIPARVIRGGQKLCVSDRFKPNGRPRLPSHPYHWIRITKALFPQLLTGATSSATRALRGWIQTGQKGEYALYTSRPAPYPNRDLPAHIHTAIKEPTIDTEYYLDEFVFDDDPLLTGAKRKALENRGGSGILRILLSGDLQIAEHNIVLGCIFPTIPRQHNGKTNRASNLAKRVPRLRPSMRSVLIKGPKRVRFVSTGAITASFILWVTNPTGLT